MNLSKSKYCAGVQCPKILWMDRNMPEQKAEQDDSRMIIGNMVGDLAMGYFGEYTEVPFDRQNIGGMIEETRRLLAAGTDNIAEASFSYNGNFCSVDILRKTGDGYEIVEVKGSSGTEDDNPAELMSEYGPDLAYQYYVLTGCGMNITKVSLMRLNREYIRMGELNLQQLFVITDCTDYVLPMVEEVGQNIERIKAVAQQEYEPDIPLSSRCLKNGCLYTGWCFRHLPEDNVFNIGWRMWGSKKDGAYQSGYVSFRQVLEGPVKLTEQQLIQVKTAVYNLPPHCEPYSIRQFLNSLSYPLYFLDFETFQQAIPLWDGVNPYRQIPFQYSLHIQERPFAEPLHMEFLGKEGEDPRRELAERLCSDIPQGACVLAYNSGFEKGIIRSLALLFPDLKRHLLNIQGNIMDLAEPFAKGYYYCREMGGSYSIKEVLPALCGGDPELDYSKLGLIHNGGEAMTAFATLYGQPPEEIERIREALLAYCRLDTLAMVKILERLYEEVRRAGL